MAERDTTLVRIKNNVRDELMKTVKGKKQKYVAPSVSDAIAIVLEENRQLKSAIRKKYGES